MSGSVGAGSVRHALQRHDGGDRLGPRHRRRRAGSRGTRPGRALGAGPYAHPGLPPDPLPTRRRAARALPAHPRSAGDAGDGGRGHDPDPGRHRRAAGSPARPDRHRQGPCHHRPAVGRPAGGRGRLRLERRGDARPRRRPRDPPRPTARARAGHAPPLGGRGGRLRRPARAVRRLLVVAQAGPTTAAGAGRRRRDQHRVRAHRRVRPGLGPDRRPTPGRRRPEAARSGGRVRPRPERPRGHPVPDRCPGRPPPDRRARPGRRHRGRLRPPARRRHDDPRRARPSRGAD